MASITVLDKDGNPITGNLLPPVGQALMAASLPVTIATNQSSIPVTNTFAIGTPAEGSSVVQDLTSLNQLSTVDMSSKVGIWFFQNQSVNQLWVVLDDGANNNVSSFLIEGNPTAGHEGASMGWQDTGLHKGRIRVFGLAGSQHALRVQ